MSLCSVGCHRNVSLFLFSVSAAQRRSGGQSVLWTHASHTNTLFFINISVPQRSSVEFYLNLSLHHGAVLYDITQNVFYIIRTSSSPVGLWRHVRSSSWFHGGPSACRWRFSVNNRRRRRLRAGEDVNNAGF